MNPPPTGADDWEEQWKKIRDNGPDEETMGEFYNKIEDFIVRHKLLWEEEGRREIIKKIVTELRQRAYDYTKGDMYAQGYYQAVSDIAARKMHSGEEDKNV